MDHTIAARCPDPGEQRTSWRDDMLHDSPWESFLILTDDGNQWKSGLIIWNACKIPAGFWSILSINWINCNISPIECLFHSSIWRPYRMKLQPLQRWALRKRWMWASWCKGCHIPSNSNIWFISCPLAIAYLMFLYEIRSKVRRSTVDSPNFYWTWWHDSPIWICLEDNLLCSILRHTSYVHQLTFDMRMCVSFPVSNRIRYI